MGAGKAGTSYRVSYTAKIMLKMSTFCSIEVKRLKDGGWNLGHVLCKLCREMKMSLSFSKNNNWNFEPAELCLEPCRCCINKVQLWKEKRSSKPTVPALQGLKQSKIEILEQQMMSAVSTNEILQYYRGYEWGGGKPGGSRCENTCHQISTVGNELWRLIYGSYSLEEKLHTCKYDPPGRDSFTFLSLVSVTLCLLRQLLTACNSASHDVPLPGASAHTLPSICNPFLPPFPPVSNFPAWSPVF